MALLTMRRYSEHQKADSLMICWRESINTWLVKFNSDYVKIVKIRRLYQREYVWG